MAVYKCMLWLKQQRQEEAKKSWIAQKQQLFRFRGLEEIEKILIERGEDVSDDCGDEEDAEQLKSGQDPAQSTDQDAGQQAGQELGQEVGQETRKEVGPETVEDNITVRVEEIEDEPAKKKKKLYKVKDDDQDRLPADLRHIRVSERQVNIQLFIG